MRASLRPLMAVLLASTALAVLSTAPMAATLNWDGSESTDWFDPDNWTPPGPPGPADNAVIDVVTPVVVDAQQADIVNLLVGDSLGGDLVIRNGGVVDGTNGEIGVNAGSEATVTVTGAGSRWNMAGSAFVGRAGTGRLNIEDGAEVTSSFAQIGGTDGSGSATVSGQASWNSTGIFYVGRQTTGSIDILSGGTLTTETLYLGDAVDGAGSMRVDGAGSAWTSGDPAFIGYNGQGRLDITDGGVVSIYSVEIGSQAGSSGGLTVSGADSQFNVTDAIFLGNYGNGSMSVTAGASVSSDYGSIGTRGVSDSFAEVLGAGSVWTNTGYLFIGNLATGELLIADGGRVESTFGTIGHIGPGGSGAGDGKVTVTGAGSSFALSTSLDVGDGYNGELTIANGGEVSVGGARQVRIGTQAGSTGILNIGAAEGDAAQASGTLDANQVIFGAGAGTLVFNHTDQDYAFDAAVSGNGSIRLRSGVTRFTASSGFTGTTDITNSTLIVDGSLLASAVTVGAGGRLGGTGYADTVIVSSGGALAPGNSIGTLVVDDITFDPGSTYDVEIDTAGNSDLVIASDIAQINGGTVRVDAAPGAYAAGMHYTIVTAMTARNGTFDAVTSNLAFLTPELSYDPNNVFLTLMRNDVGFAQIAMTPNQAAAGAGMESLGMGHPVYDAVLNLTTGDARSAFDQLSGEVHATLKGALVEGTRATRSLIGDRLRQTFATVSVLDGRAADAPDAEMPARSYGITFWGTGFGARRRAEGGRSGAADANGHAAGFLLGADAMVAEQMRAGLAGGYSDGGDRVASRASSSRTGSYHVLGYGGGRVGGWSLSVGVEHIWHDVDATRTLAFPGLSETLTSHYSARTAQVFAEAGRPMALGRAMVEPHAGVAFVRHARDGFTERGGSAALTAFDDVSTTLFSSLGVRTSLPFDLGPGRSLTLSGGAAWRHAAGDIAPLSTLSFAGGSPFTVGGAPIARHALALETGLTLNLSAGATIGIGYAGQIAEHSREHAARGHFALQF